MGSDGLGVFLQGNNRICIVGAERDSPTALAVKTWLAKRQDVTQVEQPNQTGVIYVDFDDGKNYPGRFLRALHDKLYSLKRPKTEKFAIRSVHSLQGRVRFRVAGLDQDQIAFLTMVAATIPGVTKTKHLSGSDTTLILYDPEQVNEEKILSVLVKNNPADSPAEWQGPTKPRWGGALACTTVLVMCISGAFPFPVLAIGITLNTIRPLQRTIEAFHEGKISIDLLDVAATFAALATGRPITAASVIWMLGVGDLLLDLSANHARNALSELMRRTEQEACRLSKRGKRERVQVDQLETGDQVFVCTGRAIPADGRVVSGEAEVDEKVLTGESHLLSKRKGDRVFASTVVVEGQLIVEVKFTGQNTEAAKIERILQTVGNKPLTLQRDALDLAGKFVLPTFGVAGLAAFFSGDITRAVCVLITDFGTGFRVALPVTALTAMTLAAREGILVKGAQYLERLSKADLIVFDKTGTLTNGVPEVVEVVTKEFEESEMIRLAASAESDYEHPVAKALKSYAEKQNLPLVKPKTGSEKYAVGLGLSAEVAGHRVQVGRAKWMKSQGLKITSFKKHLARLREDAISNLCVAVDGRVVGVIGYCDGTRPESRAIVRKLRANGRRKVVLLSGDSAEVVRNVASELAIDEAIGGLLPDEKADYVRKRQAEGHVVAMIGDGINDVPALVSADVGISFDGGSEVAIETADVMLLGGGLARLAKAFTMSDEAMIKVRENLGIIVAPNAVAIFLGAFGFISPPMAAIINNGTTIVAALVAAVPLLNRSGGHISSKTAVRSSVAFRSEIQSTYQL
jgi:heavy metal translocating P-type ATPase